jgi:hypothetical protein
VSPSFFELFAKFNPLEIIKDELRVDLNNPSPAVEKLLELGAQSERVRIYNAVCKLNVDSFDDICYKADVLALLEADSERQSN